MRLGVAALLAALVVAAPAAAQDRPGDFDFYVLALTWNPAWCATAPEAGRSPQCRGPARGFVVHGLWPQREHGYPEHCSSRFGDRIPGAIADDVADIMPDRRLVFSEWRKHGSCTGLSPDRYFAATRSAFEQVVIPSSFTSTSRHDASAGAVEQAFVRDNPGLRPDGIAVACEADMLTEIRICLDRELRFRACPEVDRRGCHAPSLDIPAP